MPVTKCVDFQRMLAFHSAPAMLGVKPANLISLECGSGFLDRNIQSFNSRAAARGIKIRKLCRVRGRWLLLVLNQRLLEKQLSKTDVEDMFLRCGYEKSMSLEQRLDRLSERISENGDFPHEIGLFLGYPLNDVKGFIDNNGENYLICGYWKVYSDEERAKRMFQRYNKCRSYIIGKLDRGEDIYSALKIS